MRRPAELAAYMRSFLEQWTDYSIRAEELQSHGDTVLAQVVQRGAGRSSGALTEQRSFMLFTFRGERIIRIESILREADALVAAGVSE